MAVVTFNDELPFLSFRVTFSGFFHAFFAGAKLLLKTPRAPVSSFLQTSFEASLVVGDAEEIRYSARGCVVKLFSVCVTMVLVLVVQEIIYVKYPAFVFLEDCMFIFPVIWIIWLGGTPPSCSFRTKVFLPLWIVVPKIAAACAMSFMILFNLLAPIGYALNQFLLLPMRGFLFKINLQTNKNTNPVLIMDGCRFSLYIL